MLKFLFVGFGFVVNYSALYLFSWILTHNFESAYLGDFFFSLSIVTFLYICTRWGWSQYVLRYCSRNLDNDLLRRSYLKNALSKIGWYGTGASLVVFCFSSLLYWGYGRGEYWLLLSTLSFFPLLKAVSEISIQYLRVKGDVYRYVFIQNMVIPVGKVLLVFLFLHISLATHLVPPIAVLISELVGLLLLFNFLSRWVNYKLTARDRASAAEETEYLKFSGVNSIAIYVFSFADIIYAGLFLQSEQVAYYQVAKQVAIVMTFLLVVVEPLVAPALARSIKNKKSQIQVGSGYSLAIYYLGVFATPILIFIFAFSKEILLLFGNEYASGDIALRILVVGQFINVITGQSGYLLSMAGYARLSLKNSIFSAILMTVIAFSLTPLFGLIGLALAVSFSNVTVNSLRVYQVWKLEKISPLSEVGKDYWVMLFFPAFFYLSYSLTEHEVNVFFAIYLLLIWYFFVAMYEYFFRTRQRKNFLIFLGL